MWDISSISFTCFLGHFIILPVRGKNSLVMSKSYLYLLSGIAAVVRVDIENALKDDEWSSTDLMQFLKDKYENETSIQKK